MVGPQWRVDLWHTRGKIAATADTVSTSKGDVHYVHALNYVSDCVKLPGVTGNYQATLLSDGSPVQTAATEGALVLTIPAEQRDPFATVVKLTPA